MNEELPTRRVEVTFVGTPPTRQIARASGVSNVQVDGRCVRCLISGSVQPFLEALHGYEVIGLTSSTALSESEAQGIPLPGASVGDGGGR
jgi:hypothetical protein